MAKLWSAKERIECVNEIIDHTKSLYSVSEMRKNMTVMYFVLNLSAKTLNDNTREINNAKGVKHND